MPSPPLRGAVIGTGYFSQFHFDAWSRMDDVDLVACCDLDAARAAETAARYGLANSYADARSLLESEDLDFVDIVTRPDTHLELCREAAAAGVAIICQKPLAPTTGEAVELVRACSGTRLMVHENFRFQPWYREIKSLLHAGAIGPTLHTVSFRNRAGDGHGPEAYLARQPYFQTMERFLLFEAGIHTVDTFRYLAGEIASVWCETRRLNPIIAGEDAALAVFRFEQGGRGLYDANRFNESTAEDPRYTFADVAVEADGGTIRLDMDGRLTVQPLGQPEREHPYEHHRRGFAGDCVLATQRHFVDRLRDGQPFETDGASYLKSIAAVDAMYRSSESGHWEQPADLGP